MMPDSRGPLGADEPRDPRDPRGGRASDRQPAGRRYLRFLRANPAADVDDELAFHIQSTIDELVAGGMSLDEARAAAHRKFGDVDDITDTLYTLSRHRERSIARGEWWQSIRQDVRFALR